MNKFNELLAEYGTMKFLITEMLLCLLAASILGLIIGWLCKAAFAREKLMDREAEWDARLRDSETGRKSDFDAAQNEHSRLGQKIEGLNASNQSLNSSLEANKSAVHKAHIEVQQLNKKQNDTQDRLQKIITEKDREITKLKHENSKGKDAPPRPFGLRSTARATERNGRNGILGSRTTPKTSDQSKQEPRSENTAGGTPTATGGAPQRTSQGFKPGTQVGADEMDKTQVIDNALTDPDPVKSYSDPLREANPSRKSDTGSGNVSQHSTSAPRDTATGSGTSTRGNADHGRHPESDRASRDNTARSDVPANDKTNADRYTSDAGGTRTGSAGVAANENVTDLTDASRTEAEEDGLRTLEERSDRPRSLWSKFKSTFSSTVDKTKL